MQNSETKFEVIVYDGRIELVPIKDAKKLNGMLKGISTAIIREKDRLKYFPKK